MRLQDFTDVDLKDILITEQYLTEELIKYSIDIESVARMAADQASQVAYAAVLKRGEELRED